MPGPHKVCLCQNFGWIWPESLLLHTVVKEHALFQGLNDVIESFVKHGLGCVKEGIVRPALDVKFCIFGTGINLRKN